MNVISELFNNGNWKVDSPEKVLHLTGKSFILFPGSLRKAFLNFFTDIWHHQNWQEF